MYKICFARWKGALWWLIRKLVGIEWNHSWIEYTSKDFNGQMAVHCSAKGVVNIPRHLIFKNRRLDRQIKYLCADGDAVSRGFEVHRECIGYKYDYYGLIVNILLLQLQKVVWWKKLSPYHNDKKFLCSEFVASILKSGGVEEFKDIEPILIDPGKLERLCRNSSTFISSRPV